MLTAGSLAAGVVPGISRHFECIRTCSRGRLRPFRRLPQRPQRCVGHSVAAKKTQTSTASRLAPSTAEEAVNKGLEVLLPAVSPTQLACAFDSPYTASRTCS